MEKQYEFLTNLVEKLNPLGLELFVRHYGHAGMIEGEYNTMVTFTDLGPRATLSCVQEISTALPSLEYDIGDKVIKPIIDVQVDFNKQLVTVCSDASDLRQLNCDMHLLRQLVKISDLSAFDKCVYLNMMCFGNNIKQWDIQGLKARYGCHMDNHTFTQYILDYSITLVKQKLGRADIDLSDN